jgi:alcohol dehydrogenase (cytochrome c)
MRLTKFSLAAPVAALLLSFASGSRLVAQDLESAQMVHPGPETWPDYHGDYSGRRHSSLTQITPQNVGNLSLAWAFQTNQPAEVKSTPILVDGVFYFTVPDNVWAIDARSGRQIWHYTRKSIGEHIGQRGVAMYKNWIYFVTPDTHLICLDARNGKVRWDKTFADSSTGYWSTMSPLIVKNHVIVGVGGDMDNLQGFLLAMDPETGDIQWRWDSTPPAGTPNGTTGGMTWITGTYDPDLNLIYWGTGNPTPVLNGHTRPGDDAYTCSIVALDADTGKLAWGFVASPHDTHDWDAVEIPVLVDADFRGQPRKMLMQASRNGYFFVLDRTNGKDLVTAPFGPVNWATGLDEQGRPIPNPDKEPAPDGRLIAPDEGGLTNYRSPSFDPKTGLFFVNAQPSWSVYFAKPADGAYGWAGADYGLWGKSQIEAIDYQTGKIRWVHDLHGHSGAGILTTDSGVLFSGDGSGNVLALDTADGKTLWHAGTGAGVGNSPLTYELDGRQYVMVSGGSVLFTFALPENTADAKGAAGAGR